MKKQGKFFLIAVDADPRIRYDRITLRASETDNITFDIFLANEKREYITSDPNKQNLSRCIQLADIVLQNNGSLNELNVQLEKQLKVIS